MKKCLKIFVAFVLIFAMIFCALSASAKYFGEMQLNTSVLIYTFLPGDCGVCYFTPTQSGTYKFYSTGNSDTIVYIYDDREVLLTECDDSYRGLNFDIDCYMQAGKTYGIYSGFSNEQHTGSFYIVVEKAGPQGDLNSDGRKNNKDLALLMQKLNGWDVSVSEVAADVNSDGAQNNKDYALLMQYLNGWSVKI